jgi:hypothetical protein
LINQIKGFCQTPSLFKGSFYDLEVFELVDIDSFNIDNIQILQKLPLGKRVEYFFDAIITQSSKYERVLKNIQIIHNKITLGELDFIIYDKKRNKYIHIEMQYKFYLYDDSFENEIDRYIGPNRNDTLVLKLKRLKNKQFPLLFNELTKDYLNDIDLNNIEQKILFKANIFLPKHLKNKKLSLINNNCIKGYYLSFEKFIQDDSFKKMSLFVPDKFDWLCNPILNENWKSYDEVKKEIEIFINKNISPLIWSKYTNNGEIIIESFFVTFW